MSDMKDFTNTAKQQQHNKALVKNATTQDVNNSGFIASRLNRDNFWNLMFFLGTSLGFIITVLIGFMPLALLFVITTGWLVKYNSCATFNKETKEFITNNGTKLKKNAGEFVKLILVSIALMFLTGLGLDSLRVSDSLIWPILLLNVTTFIPALYCILLNFPIAVFFYKAAWQNAEDNPTHRNNSRSRNANKPMLGLDRLRTDPIRGSLRERTNFLATGCRC